MPVDQYSILIVDDEPAICDLLVAELSEWGYNSTAVRSAEEALTDMTGHSFDVALVDVRLPGLSGTELLVQMRNREIPTATIMISAINDVDVAVLAMRLGASDYIVKPLDMWRLLESIRAILYKDKRREIRSCEPRPEPSPTSRLWLERC